MVGLISQGQLVFWACSRMGVRLLATEHPLKIILCFLHIALEESLIEMFCSGKFALFEFCLLLNFFKLCKVSLIERKIN